MRVTHSCRAALAGVGLTLFMLLSVTLVSAHAELQEAVPTIGGTYQGDLPAEIRLRFSEQLEAEGCTIALLGANFEQIALEPVQVAADDPYTMFVPLPPLEPGTYTVNWQSTSVDGDPLQGSYSFAVIAPAGIEWRAIVSGLLALGLIGAGVMFLRHRPRQPSSGPVAG